MKICKIEFTKNELLSLPPNERVFLIYAGHALNELNILCRMVVFAMPIRRNEAERQFMIGQTLVMLRFLAGKLHEMWVLFKQAYYSSKLSKTFAEKLSEDELAGLRNLKKYFSKSSASVTAVRHLHAFHYDLAQVDRGLSRLEPEMTLDIYFDATSTNTFYGFADSVISTSVMAAIDESSNAKAFEILLSDTEEIAKLFQQTLEGIMNQIIKLRLAEKFVPENVLFEDVASTKWDQIKLPTFVDSPGPWQVTLEGGKVLKWGGQNIDAPEFLRTLLTEVR